MEFQAAVLTGINKPLEIKKLRTTELSVGQVLVKIEVSGICGAQLQEISGQKGNEKFLPHLMGHEGSGVVTEVGEGVRSVKPGDKVVMHCYSGDLEFAKKCADQGWYMSFAGNITIKRNQHLRDCVEWAPRELLLVETDAPFLTPEPFRGRPNASYLVPITVRKMAEIRGLDENEMAAALTENTVRVYGSWSEGL